MMKKHEAHDGKRTRICQIVVVSRVNSSPLIETRQILDMGD